MTNEELCLLIQQGHEELIPELWEQCHDYVAMMAGKYAEGFPQLDRSVKEDCIQEAYFGFLDAVRLYKGQKSGFLHYLGYHLTNAFKRACCGGRTERRQRDPLNNAISIDAQIDNGDDESFTLADLIADKEQGQQTEYTIQPELEAMMAENYWQSVNGFMHNAIDESSDDAGRMIYHFMLSNDCGFRDAIRGLYGEDALQNKELMKKLEAGKRNTRRDFRNYWNSSKGKEERKRLDLDEAVFSNGLRSYGLKRYIEHGYSSFVESIVIKKLSEQEG